MSQTSPYTPADRARWKKALLAKGAEVASKLEDLLANKDVSFEDFSLFATEDPVEAKEARLRQFLDLLMDRMRSVEAPNFGWVEEEARFRTVAELDQAPWTAS